MFKFVTACLPDQKSPTGSSKTVHNLKTAYLSIGDQFDDIFGSLPLKDINVFPDLPEIHTVLFAMMTIFQYAERLTDQQAVEAVRTRMDWKYALHLPVNFPGFDSARFKEFRIRLCRKKAAHEVFKDLFVRLIDAGLLSRKKKSLTPLEILKSVNVLNNLTTLVLSMRRLLEALAAAKPEWLGSIALPHWYERYGDPRSLLDQVTSDSGQEEFGQSIGEDGVHLLNAISEAEMPELMNLPEVIAMKQVWQEQFEWVGGKLSWQKSACTDYF